jgi:hypothetical protein
MKKERKEKYPLSSQKNENHPSETKNEDEGGNGGARAHKEKSPLTNDNSTFSDQQLKEKISNITENNDNLSNNNHDDDNADLNQKKR